MALLLGSCGDGFSYVAHVHWDDPALIVVDPDGDQRTSPFDVSDSFDGYADAKRSLDAVITVARGGDPAAMTGFRIECLLLDASSEEDTYYLRWSDELFVDGHGQCSDGVMMQSWVP